MTASTMDKQNDSRWTDLPDGPSTNTAGGPGNETVTWPRGWTMEQKRNWIRMEYEVFSKLHPEKTPSPNGHIALLEWSLDPVNVPKPKFYEATLEANPHMRSS